MLNQPDFIIYAQHGWADDAQEISKLAQSLGTEKNLVITPDLGWLNTWIRIEPLIEKLEKIVIKTKREYPHLPMRIIGHSLGGLIWLELLKNHPQWYSHIHSLVLIASPVGGADLARIIDPFPIGIGIARDLGKNRRLMAESIAKVIPTLVIAGDIDNGSDGTITVETTKFNYSNFVCLKGLSHAQLKNHGHLVQIIGEFWQNPLINPISQPNFSTILIEHFRSVSGMTDAHYRDFKYSKPYIRFENGITIRTWKNTLGIDYVFIANSQDQCIYGGFVGWIHSQDLSNALEMIEQKYDGDLISSK
jgi:pimeloyl-ACP methyl ester carboxylesterase